MPKARDATTEIAAPHYLVEAIGLALVSRLDAASSSGEIAVALALPGRGIGLFTTPNTRYVMSGLPRSHQGRAGSVVVLMRMPGFVIGAVVATLAYDRLGFGGRLHGRCRDRGPGGRARLAARAPAVIA